MSNHEESGVTVYPISTGTSSMRQSPWLRHVLERIAERPVNRVDDFLPWNYAGQLVAT